MGSSPWPLGRHCTRWRPWAPGARARFGLLQPPSPGQTTRCQPPSLPLKGCRDYLNALTFASLFPLFAESAEYTGRSDPFTHNCHQNHLRAEAVCAGLGPRVPCPTLARPFCAVVPRVGNRTFPGSISSSAWHALPVTPALCQPVSLPPISACLRRRALLSAPCYR